LRLSISFSTNCRRPRRKTAEIVRVAASVFILGRIFYGQNGKIPQRETNSLRKKLRSNAHSGILLELDAGYFAWRPLLSPYIANEPFYGWKTSKLGRIGRVCGRIQTIGYVGINKSPQSITEPFVLVGFAAVR
jgi:hypothetical protein